MNGQFVRLALHQADELCSVADNAKFYGENQLPFVMGTTGGDRSQLIKDTEDAGVYAVIAPQMGKQVCYLQLHFTLSQISA